MTTNDPHDGNPMTSNRRVDPLIGDQRLGVEPDEMKRCVSVDQLIARRRGIASDDLALVDGQ